MVRFEFLHLGDGRSCSWWFTMLKLQTDDDWGIGSWMQCLAKLNVASIGRNLKSPLMSTLWTVTILESFCNNSPKQMEMEACRRWIHKESCKLIEIWWSLDQKSLMKFLRNWEKMEGKVVTALGMCNCD